MNILTEDVWRTKDGRVIPLSRLEDDHLIEIITFLRQRNRAALLRASYRLALGATSYAATAPDGAAMAAEEYANEVMTSEGLDSLLVEMLPIFASLLREMKRRGVR